MRANEKEMRRSYNHYCKCVDSIPDYLKKEIKKYAKQQRLHLERCSLLWR